MRLLRKIPTHFNFTQEHSRMLHLLSYNYEILQEALSLPSVWIKGLEFVFSNDDEKIDMIFQDRFNASSYDPETTLFVVELKSDIGDHELIGQIKKAVVAMEKQGKAYHCWNKVTGIAIAPQFTNSGLELLWQENYKAFQWHETNDSLDLRELSPKQPVRKAMPKEIFEKIKLKAS